MTETERTTGAPSGATPEQAQRYGQLAQIKSIDPQGLNIWLDTGNDAASHAVMLEHEDLGHLVKQLERHGSGTPEGGIVLVLLDVDGEGMDVVLVEPRSHYTSQAEETLAQAWEAITPAREALMRVRKA